MLYLYVHENCHRSSKEQGLNRTFPSTVRTKWFNVRCALFLYLPTCNTSTKCKYMLAAYENRTMRSFPIHGNLLMNRIDKHTIHGVSINIFKARYYLQ